jgi:hypothetical protein
MNTRESIYPIKQLTRDRLCPLTHIPENKNKDLPTEDIWMDGLGYYHI